MAMAAMALTVAMAMGVAEAFMAPSSSCSFSTSISSSFSARSKFLGASVTRMQQKPSKLCGAGSRSIQIGGMNMVASADAEARAAAAMEMETKGYQKSAMSKSNLPLSLIVGQQPIKTALLLAAVNPQMGGVIIAGGRGTGKSVMARALHRLLPPIEIVKGSKFNIDPNDERGEIDDFLANELAASGKDFKDLETEVIECPFVQVPLNVLDDRLLGSVDVEQSVRQGKTVFEPGLLAKAHRGVLYVDDINLLDNELSNILLSVVSEGWVNVEREGISVRYPCRPLLIATFNPEESELRSHLLDRIAVSLSADANPLSLDDRVEAVNSYLGFAEKTMTADDIQDMEDSEESLRTRIIFAREDLKETKISPKQIAYLCGEASRAGVQGHRAELFACEVAKANAALNSRAVNADDLKQSREETEDDVDEEDTDQPDNENEEEEQAEPEPEIPQVPPPPSPPPLPPPLTLTQEFMFEAEDTVVDAELLNFMTKQKSGSSGGRGLIFSQERGRYIKAMLPRGRVTRLAVDATMRASAPYQASRRRRAEDAQAAGGKKGLRRVYIENSDVRIKKMVRKAGALVIFAVDASGSMALNRMNAAKGACMSLLSEAYQSRDKICLIPFQGDKADVLLPPTRSIAMAKKRLETLPCGGGSPLAHALSVAMRTGINAQKSGDVGKVVVVAITDGRANVPLAVSEDGEVLTPEMQKDKKALKEELIATARQMRGLSNFNLVVLDTENKFVSTGSAKELAEAAGGRYHYIPKADDASIAGVAKEAIASFGLK
ncbi:Mg chelatase, subunitD [Guillardia theta CCMP2712]|uniref:Mg-protoporphyrin IX chelatase n=1 Tax=Guillardia theta (strain CCMP2712) TaxID=905079 RepID=L1ICF5_GUITC|nr:Mg chelatase, subunitD [Guillardia theta CCMP2712]EKX33520.1 Mg chelatase, subunitD [Guillardia theta CCMP2712]|eukprot:XP_005820500.1 Mg chelatase, subunitD [Guillardia theta CCMP2712]